MADEGPGTREGLWMMSCCLAKFSSGSDESELRARVLFSCLGLLFILELVRHC